MQLEHLHNALGHFQLKFQNFSGSLLQEINSMKWLELAQNPIVEDVDKFMGYVSRWPLFVNMISASLCLGFSAVFHLCYVYSSNVGKLLAKLDYAGIIILIYGSSMPPIHYYFSCGELIFWRNLLTVFLTIISLITFCVTLLP